MLDLVMYVFCVILILGTYSLAECLCNWCSHKSRRTWVIGAAPIQQVELTGYRNYDEQSFLDRTNVTIGLVDVAQEPCPGRQLRLKPDLPPSYDEAIVPPSYVEAMQEKDFTTQG